MKTNLRKALVALALAGASTGVGVTLAGAQIDPTTPTTQPSTEAPQNPADPGSSDGGRKEDCPKDGTRPERGTRDGGGGSAPQGTSALRETRIRLT